MDEPTRDCLTSQTRALEDLPDYYALSDPAASIWNDPDFEPTCDAFYWKDLGEDKKAGTSEPSKMKTRCDKVTWKRASSTFSKASLFGKEGVRPEDVEQGQIGNCWFMASLTALAEKKERVESLFVGDGKLSKQGIYAIQFYALNVPHTVIIDDWLPLVPEGYSYTTQFAKISDDSALWPALIEKAFAKLHGNYKHIISGHASQSMRTLYGSPYQVFEHDDKSSAASKTAAINELW